MRQTKSVPQLRKLYVGWNVVHKDLRDMRQPKIVPQLRKLAVQVVMEKVNFKCPPFVLY